jgi:hypothetical protein
MSLLDWIAADTPPAPRWRAVEIVDAWNEVRVLNRDWAAVIGAIHEFSAHTPDF